MVASLRATFGLRHIYCWHGLSAYWSGVAPDEPGMAAYQVRTAAPLPCNVHCSACTLAGLVYLEHRCQQNAASLRLYGIPPLTMLVRSAIRCIIRKLRAGDAAR